MQERDRDRDRGRDRDRDRDRGRDRDREHAQRSSSGRGDVGDAAHGRGGGAARRDGGGRGSGGKGESGRDGDRSGEPPRDGKVSDAEDGGGGGDDSDSSELLLMTEAEREALEERKRQEARKRRAAIAARYAARGATDDGGATTSKASNGAAAASTDTRSSEAVAGAAAAAAPASSAAAQGAGEAGSANGAGKPEAASGGAQEPAASPSAAKKAADDFDMFADDVDVAAAAGGHGLAEAEEDKQDDNFDDGEGYYKLTAGEVVNGRYKVLGTLGKGVFSSVAYARDTTGGAGMAAGGIVAIKFIRSNDLMRRAGVRELELLQTIREADPEGKSHIVRMLESFDYRGHLCLVFEPLHMNMKEVANKFGKGVGISLDGVRMYARQMFLALHQLSKLGIVHADIKLHNMLCDEGWQTLKLCDFGSAFRLTDQDNVPAPYLVSRFYRAPEIMLGLEHSPKLDIWSVGCCLYELYTGKLLFDGVDNNDMLWQHMQLRGPFPNKMIRRHIRASVPLEMEPHFTDDLRFVKHELDPVTSKPTRRYVSVLRPTKDMGRLLAASSGHDSDRRQVGLLRDLLDSIFVLDPAKRIDVSAALRHPFIVGKKMGPKQSEAGGEGAEDGGGGGGGGATA